MRLRLAVAGALLVSTLGCRDLELDPPPQRGSLTALIELGGHLSPADQPVDLIDRTGSRATQRTNAEGRFTFGDLQPGVYTLSVKLPGFAALVEPGVVVTSGAPTDLGTLTPDWLVGTPAEGTLVGKVGVTGGVGDVTGALVEFILSGQKLAATTVGTDGAFAQRLPPGTYTVRASHPWYQVATRDDVVIAEGATNDVSAMPLLMDINPATLTGGILVEREGQTAIPRAGVKVHYGAALPAETDQAGRFSIPGLPAGARTLRFELAGYTDVVPERTVVLEPGLAKDLGTITLKLVRGVVTGSVKMADDSSASGVAVELSGTRYATTASADATDPSVGRFILRDVPFGTYDVVARKANYSPAAASASIVDDTPVDVGALTLTLLQGDFDIDDGDALNLGGYTRTLSVTLVFNRFPTTGVASYRASEDSTFANDTQAWLPYTGLSQPFTLSGGDGRKVVYAQYKDAAGNASRAFSAPVTLDTTPPTLTSVEFDATSAAGATPRFTNVSGRDLSVQVSGSDPLPGSTLARMRVGESVDGGVVLASPAVYATSATLQRGTLVDGPQPVWVQLIDGAGNQSLARGDTIIVDTLSPTGALSVRSGSTAQAGYTNSVLATLDLSTTAEPNGGQVFVKLSNANGTPLDSAVLQPVSAQVAWFLEPLDGTKTVYARFVDSAGNESTEASGSVVLDRVAPNPASVALTSPAITNSRDAGLAFTVDTADLASVTPLTLSENQFFSGATPLAYPMSGALQVTLSDADGDKTLFARFRDKAGNDSFSSVGVRLDRVAPTLSLSLLGTLADGARSSEVTASTTVDVTLITNETSWYVLGNETLTACPAASSGAWVSLTSSTLSAQALTGAASPRQVRACVRDAAGNITGPVTASIALDATAPSGCALALAGSRADGVGSPPAGYTASSTVRVSLGSCAETPFEYALVQDVSVSCTSAASLTWLRYSSTATLTWLLTGGEGLNTVRGCVRDQARNVGAIAAGSITLDTTPPQSPYVVIDDGAEFINDDTATARGGNVGVIKSSVSGATEWALSEDPATFSGWSLWSTTPRNYTFGGAGVRTLYAKFRDDLGNGSAVAFDSVDIDRVAPDPTTAGSVVSLRSTSPNAEYTNSVSVVAELRNTPADTWQVKLAEASGACSAATVSGVNAVPVTTTYTFLLSSGDGLKRACVQYLDRAGNKSATLVSDTITLDTTPPTTMRIITPPAVVSLDAGSSFPVEVAALSSDDSDAGITFEQLGGAVTTWTTVTAPSAAPWRFPFTVANTGAQLGTPNDFQLRAKDAAGNVSGVASVLVTADTVPPGKVTTNATWLDNTNGGSTFYWKSPNQNDVTYNLIRYGSSPTDLTGTFASQGISPVRTPPVENFTLSNLPNGSPVWVTITPIDAAGNAGTPSDTILLQANEVSPNLMATLTVPNFAAGRLAALGTALYVAGVETTDAGCTGNSVLQTIDLRPLSSPVQNGGIVAMPQTPVVASTKTFADTLTCVADGQNVDVIVDGINLFLVAGKRVHIFDVSDPLAPVELTAAGGVDLSSLGASYNASSASVLGDRLFINSNTSGANVMAVLSLAKLHDNLASTRPTSADLMASATLTTSTPSMALTRNRAMAFGSSGGGGSAHYNVGGVLDGGLPDGGTAVTGSITAIGTGNAINLSSRPPVSGNYLYAVGRAFGFTVFDLTQSWTAVGSPVNFDAVGVSTTFGSGQFEVHGTEAFAVDTNKYLHGVDLTDATLHRETAGYTLDAFDGRSSGAHVLTHGNYLVVAAGPSINFVEVATPRAMRTRSSLVGGGWRPAVHGGFVVMAGRYTTFDVQAGALPVSVLTSPGQTECSTGFTMLDDLEVLAQGQRISFIDHENEFDRNALTTQPPMGTLSVAGGGRVTDVDAVGNRLIATEVRSGAGVFLDVFDVRKQRDRNPLTSTNSTSDQRGSFQLPGTPSTTAVLAETAMWGSYAVVTIDGVSGIQNVFVVDLRAWLDDDATTTTPTITAQFGLANSARARSATIYHPFVAIASSAGVQIFNLAGAFDTSSATVPNTAPLTVLSQNFEFDSTAVFGSYLFAMPSSSLTGTLPTGMPVYDISAPSASAWVQTASMPLILKAGSLCNILGDTSRLPRNTIVVKGSRAWLNIENTLREISLE